MLLTSAQQLSADHKCAGYIISPWIGPTSITITDVYRNENVEISLELYLSLLSAYVDELHVCQRNPEKDQGYELNLSKKFYKKINELLSEIGYQDKELRNLALELGRKVKQQEDRYSRDKKIYDFISKMRKIKHYILDNLHAKIYAVLCYRDSIPNGVICIGSPNLTYSGLFLNDEILACIHLQEYDDQVKMLLEKSLKSFLNRCSTNEASLNKAISGDTQTHRE